jgi:hypothetical protein
VYILQLKEHHPNLVGKSGQFVRPSLNVALEIFAQRTKEGNSDLPPKAMWKRMWREWGPIAPLWAAVELYERAAAARGAPLLSLHDIKWRRQIVASSLWIADFTEEFRPLGGTAPLLPKNSVIRPHYGTKAKKPVIPPLTDELQRYAQAYSHKNW